MVKFLAGLVFLFASLASAQVGAITDFCKQGATPALTSSLKSSNSLQGIIPQCTVTVFLTGTITKATIYSDALSTPLGNPFTASTKGQWLFFAALNQGYDVVLSGGIAPNIYPAPITLTGLFPSQQVIVGSANITNQVSGVIPLATGASALTAPSHLDDGKTTTGTVTSSEPFASALVPIVTGIADWHDTTSGCRVYRGQVNVRDCGADPTGATDSTTAIQLAHTTICGAGGGKIYYPNGLYIINNHLGPFVLCSNLTEYGTPGATTLRESATTGDFAYIFGPLIGGSPTLSNITFSGLTIDENGTNNNTAVVKIAPCTALTGAYGAPFSCYQYVWDFQGNYNGFVQHMTVENCTLLVDGIAALGATDGSNTHISTVTSDINFLNNKVVFGKNAGVSTYDNSALYIDAVGYNIQGNKFSTKNSAVSDGATTGIELHGGPGKSTNNSVDWYFLGGYFANSQSVVGANNIVTNTLEGFAIFPNFPVNALTLSNNIISLNNSDRFTGSGTANSFGIANATAPLTGAVTNLKITGNTVIFQQDQTAGRTPNYQNSGGVGLGLFTNASITGVDMENNTVQNAPVSCIIVGSSTGGTVTNAAVAFNHLTDCGTLPATIALNSGMILQGTLTNVQIHKNDMHFTTNPFAGHYSIVGNPLTVSNGFVADNVVDAVNGSPTVNLSASMSQSFPSNLISSVAGYKINNAAATAGHYLRGNGTNYVDGTIQTADLPASITGSIINYVSSTVASAGDSGNMILMNCVVCNYTLPSGLPLGWHVQVVSISSTDNLVLSGSTWWGAGSGFVLTAFRVFTIYSNGGNNFVGQSPLLAGTGITLTPGATGMTIASGVSTVPVNTCGTTTTCSNTAQTAPRIVHGNVALTAGSAVVASMTAWTATTSFDCTGTDKTGLNPVQIVNTSTTSITITGTSTDVIAYTCVGN